MQTDKNDMNVEKSVSMHSHAFEQPCKRQIVTDIKSRNTSQILVTADTERTKIVDVWDTTWYHLKLF